MSHLVERFISLPCGLQERLLALAEIEQAGTRKVKRYPAPQRKVTIQPFSVISAAAKVLNLSVADILSPKRHEKYSLCRFMIFHLLRLHGHSTVSIGKIFGRGHSAVITGTQTHADLMDVDRKYQENFRKVEAMLVHLTKPTEAAPNDLN